MCKQVKIMVKMIFSVMMMLIRVTKDKPALVYLTVIDACFISLLLSTGRCVQLSMDSEDDICVLPQSPKDEVDAFTHPDQHIILFSPLSPVPDFDRGSHQALQKAYSEVKRRLNESNAKNQVLSKRVWELESTRSSSSFIGMFMWVY